MKNFQARKALYDMHVVKFNLLKLQLANEIKDIMHIVSTTDGLEKELMRAVDEDYGKLVDLYCELEDIPDRPSEEIISELKDADKGILPEPSKVYSKKTK